MKNFALHRAILSSLFAVAICCFFGIVYPHHLHFQEQYQLFLFDVDYALDVMALPGGVADYIGRFFTQFFIYAWMGAVLMALLLVGVQLLLSRDVRNPWLYALSYVPSLLLWRLMLDENALPGAVVAVLLCLLYVQVLQSVRPGILRCIMSVLGLPLMYWLAGPIALWLVGGAEAIFCIVPNIPNIPKKTPTITTLILLLLLALALPTIARHLVAVDLDRLVSGVHYFRHTELVAWPLWAAVAVALGTLFFRDIRDVRDFGELRDNSVGCSKRVATGKGNVLQILLTLLIGIPLIWTGINLPSEEVMAYDFMARHQMWNRILQAGTAKEPNNPTTATVHNLAMAMKGRLAEHMFDYPQHGTSGLLPKFVRDPFSPLATSEVFYQLGMINTAQQFVFEAQEAIPDFQKSARCYKRLAETNLINGAYDVARKYLLALRKTWYYRAWADQTLLLLGDEEAIARHPEYGKLRRQNIQASFFFSDQELPQMLGQLLMSNRQNRLAFEYLEATYLLEGRLDNFAQCYGLSSQLAYPVIPMVFQQALLLFWSRDHAASEKMPAGFRPDVVQQMHQFYADIQSKRYTTEQLRLRWGKTYWYYYFYLKS